MYTGLDTPLRYDPPWNIPFPVRRGWMAGGDLRVAYVYELEDTSTFRYRVFNMVEAMRADPQRRISATWYTRAEFHHDQSFVDSCDVLVLCRTRYDEAIARLVERARSRRVKVLFDVDDLVFDLSYVHYIMDAIGVSTTSEENWDYWYAYVGRLRATLDLCDGGIATTGVLADRMRLSTGGVPCGVLPNFLNRTQTEISDSLVAAKAAGGSGRDGRVTLGFLSGSPTHLRDLLVASPAIASSMEKHPDLRILMVGFADLNEYLKPFERRVDRLPLQDYLNLQRVAAQCEFCLVPLAINAFSSCKSELKFFETGIVGCPIVASPIPSYAGAIDDGRNGLLAAAHRWHDQLERAYAMAVHGGREYREMAAAAHQTSVDVYGWDRQADRIAAVFDEHLTGRAPVAGGPVAGGTVAGGSVAGGSVAGGAQISGPAPGRSSVAR